MAGHFQPEEDFLTFLEGLEEDARSKGFDPAICRNMFDMCGQRLEKVWLDLVPPFLDEDDYRDAHLAAAIRYRRRDFPPEGPRKTGTELHKAFADFLPGQHSIRSASAETRRGYVQRICDRYRMDEFFPFAMTPDDTDEEDGPLGTEAMEPAEEQDEFTTGNADSEKQSTGKSDTPGEGTDVGDTNAGPLAEDVPHPGRSARLRWTLLGVAAVVVALIVLGVTLDIPGLLGEDSGVVVQFGATCINTRRTMDSQSQDGRSRLVFVKQAPSCIGGLLPGSVSCEERVGIAAGIPMSAEALVDRLQLDDAGSSSREAIADILDANVVVFCQRRDDDSVALGLREDCWVEEVTAVRAHVLCGADRQ